MYLSFLILAHICQHVATFSSTFSCSLSFLALSTLTFKFSPGVFFNTFDLLILIFHLCLASRLHPFSSLFSPLKSLADFDVFHILQNLSSHTFVYWVILLLCRLAHTFTSLQESLQCWLGPYCFHALPASFPSPLVLLDYMESWTSVLLTMNALRLYPLCMFRSCREGEIFNNLLTLFPNWTLHTW